MYHNLSFTVNYPELKKYFLLVLIISCSLVAVAQTNERENRDSLRKVFYGKYSYTHSYGWENFDMPDGTHMEVIPLSDEVTYYELELYRYGSFSREVTSNKETFMYFHHIDFGTWRMEGDTMFLKVTEVEYDYRFTYYPSYSNGINNCVTVENPVEEKMYLVQGTYFCNYLDWQANRDYSICYTKKEY